MFLTGIDHLILCMGAGNFLIDYFYRWEIVDFLRAAVISIPCCYLYISVLYRVYFLVKPFMYSCVVSCVCHLCALDSPEPSSLAFSTVIVSSVLKACISCC